MQYAQYFKYNIAQVLISLIFCFSVVIVMLHMLCDL